MCYVMLRVKCSFIVSMVLTYDQRVVVEVYLVAVRQGSCSVLVMPTDIC